MPYYLPNLDPKILPGKGAIPAKYALVGIAPSPNRPASRKNEPFGASSYHFLNKLKQKYQFSDQDLYVTNAVKEAVDPGKKPPKSIVRDHYPLLIEELKIVSPERILALGALPAELLCPGFTTLREDHGTIFYNPELNCEVVPTYHFSAIARDPQLISFLSRDFERFIKLERKEASIIQTITLAELSSLIREGQDVYLDIETTGLDEDKDEILAVGLRFDDQNYQLKDPTPSEVSGLLNFLRSKEVHLIGHNLSFDLHFLFKRANDFRLGFKTSDTMLMAHVAGEEHKALKSLATFYTDSAGSRSYGGPEDSGYLASDLVDTEAIYHVFYKKVGDRFITQLLNRLIPYSVKMRYDGVHIDYPKLVELKPQAEKIVSELHDHLDSLSKKEINWNSTKQVVDFLLSQGVILLETTDTGAFTIKESVLVELAKEYPVAQQLLDYREAKKELEFYDSYVEKLTISDPYLHPKLKFTGTVTGRLSCSDPNLQQVKRTGPIKLIFNSRYEGGLIGLIDLSQAELRVAALMANDLSFAEALLSDDVHLQVASMIYSKPPSKVSKTERKASKAITFGLLYGGSPAGLAERSGLTIQDVKKVITNLYEKFPGLEKYIEAAKEKAIEDQFTETPFGRIRNLKSLILEKGEHDAARKAINTPIQATASDIGLIIMYHLNRVIEKHNLKSRVIFGVHDSVLTDVHPDEVEIIQSGVQRAFKLLSKTPLVNFPLYKKLPITGDFIVGKTWAHVESTNENFDPQETIECSSL